MFLLTKCGILPTREATTLREGTKANLTFCFSSANPWECKKIQENEVFNMNKKHNNTTLVQQSLPSDVLFSNWCHLRGHLVLWFFWILVCLLQRVALWIFQTLSPFSMGPLFQPCQFCCTRRVWWRAMWVGAAQFGFCLFVALVGPFVAFCGSWALPKQPENSFVVVVAVFTHYWNCLFNQCAFC